MIRPTLQYEPVKASDIQSVSSITEILTRGKTMVVEKKKIRCVH